MGVLGGQANVDYTFMISGVDTVYDKDAAAMALVNVGADGSYDVRMIATMRNGGNCSCDITKKMIVVDRLSVGRQGHSWNAVMLPNPAQTEVTVVMQGADALKRAEVYSMDGRLIRSFESGDLVGSLGNWTFSVVDFSSGVYWVKLVTERGEKAIRLMKK
jgi:hypothetical protein